MHAYTPREKKSEEKHRKKRTKIANGYLGETRNRPGNRWEMPAYQNKKKRKDEYRRGGAA